MRKIAVAVIISAVFLIGIAGAQTYSDSPATGSMGGGIVELEDKCFDTEEEAEDSAAKYGGGSVYESGPYWDTEYCVDYDKDRWFSYKAGEFTVEAEGILPPTNERLVVTSLGKEEGWEEIDDTYGVSEGISGRENEEFLSSQSYGEHEEDDYYAWTPDKPGLYEVYINATLTSVRQSTVSFFGSSPPSKISADLRVWKDERGVCNPSFYDGKVEVNSRDLWSKKCGYIEKRYDRGYIPKEQNLGLEYSRYGMRNDKDSVWDYDDVGGEHDIKVADWEVPAPPLNTSNCGFSCKNTTTQTFTNMTTLRVRNQGVVPISGDRRSDTVMESFHFYLNGVRGEYDDDTEGVIKGNATINNFSLNYIDPIGNTVVEVDDKVFAGDIQAVSDVETTLDPSQTGWQNTSRSVTLDLSGEFERMEFDDTKRVILNGEYKAVSPPGVNPEGYRWVKKSNPSEVLAEYSSIDSGGSSEHHEKTTDIDTDSTPLEEGEYVLQIKSDASNYPVDLGVRDFTLKTDEYIRIDESKEYSPQLNIGTNNVEIYTSHANNLNYRFEWDECLKSDISGRNPDDGAFTSTTSPSLEVTVGCNSVDNVTFRDARTDTVVAEYQNIANGERLTADTDLSIGDTYRWYVRLCDQGVCYDSDTWEFTVGRIDTISNPVEINELEGKGLKKNIRDEDFNSLGEDSPGSNALHRGYVNKLEEESDQLEPGMGSAFYGMNESDDPITVGKWKDSVGTENRSDQWAITPHRNWTISNRGVPYPPWGTYYRSDDPEFERTSASDPSIPQTEKVFGNSLAVVAQEDVYDGSGTLIARKGSGVWIDPDDIREWMDDGGKYEYPYGEWYKILGHQQAPDGEVVGSKMDITGPDSGLGADDGSTDESVKPLNTEGTVLKGDIYFHGE